MEINVSYNEIMIRDTIKTDVITALKAGEKEKASFLRVLISEIQNTEIALKGEGKLLTEDNEIAVLTKELKRRKEASGIYERAGEKDRVAKEEFEISVITSYLPEQLSEDEIREVVVKVVALQESPDFGSAMKESMTQLKGKADGKVVSEIVRSELIK